MILCIIFLFPQVLIDFAVIINTLLCYCVYGANLVIRGGF